MKKIKFTCKDLRILLIALFICAILVVIGWLLINNSPQSYPDFIVDILSEHGGNKTGELTIWWLVFLIGATLTLLLQKKKKENAKTSSLNIEEKPIILIEGVSCIANVAILILSGNINLFLTAISIIVFLNYLVNPKKVKEGLILAIIAYYLLMAITSIGIFTNIIHFNISKTILIIGAGIIDLLILSIDRKKSILNHFLSIAQIFIPFCLLLFIRNQYIYNNENLTLNAPLAMQIIIYLTIGSMILISLFRNIKNWKEIKTLKLSRIILLSTCIVVWICNSVTINNCLIAPEDMNHPAENIIGFQQTMLGQELYTDYSPTSGLFTWVIGGVSEVLGGNYTSYNFAHALFMAIIAAISMFILSKHLKKDDCLVASILFYSSASSIFYFQNYDRAALILPILLILALPKLITRSNLWLKAWILSSLISGLYYPTYGLGIVIGGLPIAILQIIRIIKDGELKRLIKKPTFYIGWALCLAPILFLSTMLLNMLAFIKNYAAQTTLADGQRIVGQEVANSFMPYIQGTPREFIYYLMQYIILMFIVWVMFIVIYKYYLLKIKKQKKKLNSLLTTEFSLYAMSVIVIIVSYYSALVRFDDGLFVDRIGLLLGPVIGIIGYIVFKKYTYINLPSIILAGIGLGIVYLTGGTPLSPINGYTILSKYQIDNNYILLDDTQSSIFPRLGEGFITQKALERFAQKQTAYKDLLEANPETQFIAAGEMSIYYVLNLKAYCQPRLQAVRDLQTHQCLLDAIDKQKAVVGVDLERSEYHYYLYRALMLNDNYKYVKEYQAFLPKALFEELSNSKDIKETPKTEFPDYSNIMQRTPNTFGESIGSLEKILDKSESIATVTSAESTPSGYTINLHLDQPISGKENEFLYLQLNVSDDLLGRGRGLFDRLFKQQFINNDVKVLIIWGDNEQTEQFTTTIGSGKLLLPLGASPNWFLRKHDKLTITILGISQEIPLQEARFYKLNETRLTKANN